MSREQPDLGLLISLVEKYSFLYDKKHKHFKNARMRDNAWDEIGRALDTGAIKAQKLWCTKHCNRILLFAVDECQRLWRNLRDRYSREKRRKPTGSQAADEPEWIYFHTLHFLDKVIRPRKTYSNISGNSSRSFSSPRVWNTMSQIVLSNDSQNDLQESEDEDDRPTFISGNSDGTESGSRFVESPEPASISSATMHQSNCDNAETPQAPTERTGKGKQATSTQMLPGSRFVKSPESASTSSATMHQSNCDNAETPKAPTERTGKGKQTTSTQMLSEIASTARTIGSHFQNRNRSTADEIFGQYVGARLHTMEESPRKKRLKREIIALLEDDA